MLLDDEEAWLRTLARGLEASGNVRCVSFRLPERALEALEAVAADLWVIDSSLGRGWTGARFALAVRSELGVFTPPLALVSGQVENVAPEDLALFDAVYPKNLEPRPLIEALLELATGPAVSADRGDGADR